MNDLLPSTANCCIVYTTDSTYLFPTLVSAIQARRHASRNKADVMIFCLDLDPLTRSVFGPICKLENIGLVSLESRVIEGQSAMLSRLFLTRFVPERYTQYLYLDGDVHILDTLDPLIDAHVPEGCFLAANDPLTFLLADNSPQSNDLRRHLRSLGLTNAQALGYFNSGVLRIHGRGWEETGMDAWRQFQSHGNNSRFPDQDALNVVAQNRRLPLSLVWNYPVFLRNCRVESNIRPRIVHFMSSPKPWHGAFPPWTQEACTPYINTIARYPALAPFRLALSNRKQAMHYVTQHGKRLIETVTWGLSKRRQRILQYQDSCFDLSASADSL